MSTKLSKAKKKRLKRIKNEFKACTITDTTDGLAVALASEGDNDENKGKSLVTCDRQ